MTSRNNSNAKQNTIIMNEFSKEDDFKPKS